ncbi:aldo/keto reductase [Citricoccus sp. NR2]|uniref:aldo/keto reductase n=1 Tax=Citricoccus sp. NR2 TaxID=3004095 RepID=UPI0022DD0E12|nr:aldo/keto reductase [Citricoccus sp. NR2]WBL20059.1 aldo/keto reductase [Citricoccus sp. NR2]
MTTIPTVPTVKLNDGHSIPQLGFGVFQVPPAETQKAVEQALEAGYRHLDTAAAYRNEEGVGRAIAASGIARDELYITTKLRNGEQNIAREAFENSLQALGLDHVDLYLIHWPAPAQDLYLQAWEQLVTARQDGLATSIGVSNFLPEHLERLLGASDVVPAVNQIEVHPTFQQTSTQAATRAAGIAVEAYSPIGQGKDLTNGVVTSIAAAHDATPAQVVLAWHLAQGTIVIPKSTHRERMEENLNAVNVTLSEDEITQISGLDTDERVGADPATSNFTML